MRYTVHVYDIIVFYKKEISDMISFYIFTIITDRVRALESSKINLVKMSVHNRNTYECMYDNMM